MNRIKFITFSVMLSIVIAATVSACGVPPDHKNSPVISPKNIVQEFDTEDRTIRCFVTMYGSKPTDIYCVPISSLKSK